MAFYRPGSDQWKHFEYNQDLWKGEGGVFSVMVNDTFPNIGHMTLVEAQETSWLYGLVFVTGAGKCEVVYPYQSPEITSEAPHKFRNVAFHEFPFTSVRAITEENFIGWFSRGNLISEDPYLVIHPEKKEFEELVELEARFS